MSAEVCRELQPKPNFGPPLANGFEWFIFYIFICPSIYSFTKTNPTLDPCLQLESIFKRFLPLLRTSLAENSLLSFLSEFLSLEIIWSCCLLSLSCGEMPPLSSHKGFSLGLAMRLRIHAVHADDPHMRICASRCACKNLDADQPHIEQKRVLQRQILQIHVVWLLRC